MSPIGKPLHTVESGEEFVTVMCYAMHCHSAIDASKRPEITGALPFMSISNLCNSDVQCTVLDDWESMLYLICWFSTIGIGKSRTRNCDDLEGYPIASWWTGTKA